MSILRATWILVPALAACASQETEPDGALEDARERMQVEAYSQAALREQTTIGLALADLDKSIQLWNKLFLNGNEATDGRRLKILQESISYRTQKLFYEIVDQLETGPPLNRRIAAAALGFVRVEESLSPLLNALSDTDDEVVANALLGIALLGDPATPTGSLADLLQHGRSSTIKNNAALALLEVLRSEAKAEPAVLTAARSGLHDMDPGVRSQSALILAHQLDAAAIEDLTLVMLEDPVPNAKMAAGQAIAYIGSKDQYQYGRVARILTAALSKVDERTKASILGNLRKLAKKNYSKDEDWIAWAHRQPPG